MDGRTDARTDNMKTVYPPQTKFAGGINPPQTKFAGGITKILMTNGSLMKVKSIAECSTLSILQYF